MTKNVFRILTLLVAFTCAALAQKAGSPAQPCAILAAQRASAEVTGAAKGRASSPDTTRLQAALNLCSPGKAVVLTAGSGTANAFETAPLIIPRGVTLFVDKGVTLYGSRNPRDYDIAPGRCGSESANRLVPTCKPLIFSYQAAYSAVSGAGILDGQGTARELVSSYESQGFEINGVTLRNASGIQAAIYKTIGLRMANVKIDGPGGTGILLSNAVDADLSDIWIRVPGEALSLKASILGATTGVKVQDLHVFGGQGIGLGDDLYGSVRTVTFDRLYVDGASVALRYNAKGREGGTPREIMFQSACLHNVAEPISPSDAAALKIDPKDFQSTGGAACNTPAFSSAPPSTLAYATTPLPRIGTSKALVVAANGEGNFRTIQQAVDALPVTGGQVSIRPGTYREVVTIRKPHVILHGLDQDPSKTVIVFNRTGPANGGTFNSGTVYVEADDVSIDHLTIANDAGNGKGQAVALAVTGDRAVFRHLRILGAQDTLFAAARYCYGDYGPCEVARQYFEDCYIEGAVDFIFGDSKAVFERCELHGLPDVNVMYTAQSRHVAEQPSGYVFDHCRLTGEGGTIALGRPWRPYSTVVFLHTQIDAPVIPAGWQEWARFGKPSLPTSFYAEYDSTGPGAQHLDKRHPLSHQLTANEAAQWEPAKFLAGSDHWAPQGQQQK